MFPSDLSSSGVSLTKTFAIWSSAIAAYVIMGYNIQSNYWMPVFLEARTGRRVYGVRYMEWTIDACGLIWLDCYCLFNRSLSEFKMALFWTVAYMM